MRDALPTTTSLLLSLALLAGGGGCGSAAPEVEAAPAGPALPPLPALPLLIPSGARTVLVAEPARLFESAAVRGVVDVVVTPELIDSFERRTGVVPAEVRELVVAELDGGFVLIARGPFPARDVVRAAEMRMNAVEARQDEPFFRRAGYLGADRRDVVALGQDVVMVSGGVPQAVAAILARAERGRWAEGGAAALESAEVAPLLEGHRGAPLALYVPEPLELPDGFGTSVLLARQRSLAASMVPEEPDRLVFRVELRGEFPEGADQNFRTMVESMGETPFGAALGIGEAARTLSIQTDAGSVTLSGRVSSGALATGLRVLFVGELQELLGGVPRSP